MTIVAIWAFVPFGVKGIRLYYGRNSANPRGPMMIEDEPAPRRRRVEPMLLDPLGVEELRGYIGELRAEIARAEAAIAKKQDHRSAADGFFKPRG